MPSDASCFGRLKLHSLLDYLQDTASLAAESFEGTSSQLIARGYSWILTRYEIEMLGPLPALDEPFLVRTFHDPEHSYGTLRVFQVCRSDGTLLAWAKTSWLLLDLTAGRPVRPAAHIPGITQRDAQPIETDFRDIPQVPAEAEFRIVPCPVRFHDLDSNGHVNNAVYFEWVFEAVPLDPMTHELRSVSAFFRSGAKWGEALSLQVAEVPDGSARSFVCRLVREPQDPSAKPMASFYCSWEVRL